MSKASDLEFGIINAKLNNEKEVQNSEYDVKFNDDGSFRVQLSYRPLETESLTTIEVLETGVDEFSGRFKPFYLIQEEIDTNELETFEGTNTEKYMLAFLLVNNDYVEKLNGYLREKLLEIIQKGKFNECN